MIRTTFISRTSDGNILCETPQEIGVGPDYNKAYYKAKCFLKTMANQPERCSVHFDEHYSFQYFSITLVIYLLMALAIWPYAIKTICKISL